MGAGMKDGDVFDDFCWGVGVAEDAARHAQAQDGKVGGQQTRQPALVARSVEKQRHANPAVDQLQILGKAEKKVSFFNLGGVQERV